MKKYYFIKSLVRFESSYSSSNNTSIQFTDLEVIECFEWYGGTNDELKDAINHFIIRFGKKIPIDKSFFGLDEHLMSIIIDVTNYGFSRIGNVNNGVYDFNGLSRNNYINNHFENIGMFMFIKDPTKYKVTNYEVFDAFITKYERLNKLKIIE